MPLIPPIFCIAFLDHIVIYAFQLLVAGNTVRGVHSSVSGLAPTVTMGILHHRAFLGNSTPCANHHASTLTELPSRLNGYCKLGFRRKLPNLELLVAVYFRVVRSSAFLQLHRAPELAVIIPRYDYCLCFVLDAMVNLFEFKGANMAVIGSFTRLPMSLEVGCLVDSWRVDSLRPVLSRVDGIIGL